MSTAFYIVLEKEEVEFDTFVNGKSIAQVADNIFELCESNSLKTLEYFISQDPTEFLDDFDLPGEFKHQWYDAQEGLDYFDSLVSLINENACGINKGEVISDLNEFIGVLQKAKQKNIKWHLELDI